jgi:hypothetical protein
MIALLCVALLLWRPLDFAMELAGTLPSLGMRGVPGVIELLWHGAVAATAVAAARALWAEIPAGPPLAAIAVTASAVASVQSQYWSVLPHQTMPGDERLLAMLSIVHAAFWLVYLARRRRIK